MRTGLEELKADGLLVTDISNIRYLSGFTGSSAFILVTRKKALFLTDSRYTTQVRSEVKGFKVRTVKKLLESVAAFVKEEKIKVLGFESGEVTYDTYVKLRKALKGVKLKPASGLCEANRLVKDTTELRSMKAAIKVLEAGFDSLRAELRTGRTEKEVALSLEFLFKSRGAEALAFDTIVASGKRSALPHGKATNKRIREGEFVVVDMGVALDGYNSDKTRTYVMGRPTKKQKKVYDTVKDAHDLAIEKVRPGVEANIVDGAARNYIKKAGFNRYFGHGTGHGVGLNVHEGPVIGPFSKDVLQEGMVFTIEPGIYIPDWGGVRIEDMVVVTKDGCSILTTPPTEIMSLHQEGRWT